jgi:hypothetical protein
MQAIIGALSALAIARSDAELRGAIGSATTLRRNPVVSAALQSAQERLEDLLSRQVEPAANTRSAVDEDLCVVCVEAAKSHAFA